MITQLITLATALIFFFLGFYFGRYQTSSLTPKEKEKMWKEVKKKIGLVERTTVTSPSKKAEAERLKDDLL